MHSSFLTQSLILIAAFGSVAAGVHARAQDPFAEHVRSAPPRSPEEERQALRVPPGFEVQLFAAEPEIQKPLNMAFDAAGRLWLTDTVEYPYAAPLDRPGRDTIKILEDTTGDGRADRIHTFADGLNIPIGISPYRDGAIAWSIPHVWRFRDTTGDGRADVRERLFGPLGYERDTHGMNNSFRRGFDGWLYACHGFNNETTVQGTDGHVVRMQSGNTYRMRLDGARVEQFTWGQVNPFGMAVDPLFNLFTADCHSKPIYQLLRGGYYPSFGKPHDGLGFAPPMMDHLHGSTAISGLAHYVGENFPPEFRGNFFSGNVMTSRVNRNALTYHGSTILAVEQPDFVVSDDPWFRPVDVQVGPDGALYVADFYNRIIGHYEVPLDHPGRDRHRGRIWRIVYTGDHPESKPAEKPTGLGDAGLDELIAALDHETLTWRMLAADRLADDFGARAAPAVRAAWAAASPRAKPHLLWILSRTGELPPELLQEAARDEDAPVRVHAMKVLAELREWDRTMLQTAVGGLADADAFVQRAAAEALGLHPEQEAIAPLLELLRRVPAEDTHLRHGVRIALRNQLQPPENFALVLDAPREGADATAIADVALAILSAEAGRFLLWYVEAQSAPPERLADFLKHAARHVPPGEIDVLARLVREKFARDLDFQLELLTSIQAGLDQRGVPAGRAVRDWAEDLAQGLLDSIDADSLAWTHRPLDGKPRPENPWIVQQRASADGDGASRFLCSLTPGGEHFTGVLRSRTFAVPPRLTFFVAGHVGFPDRPVVARNFVRLREAETGERLAECTPPRNDVAQPVEWDLREHAGKPAYLEVVDGDDGPAYAWLAVGRFEPAVVPLPRLSPRLVARRQESAATLVQRFRLEDLGPRLKALVRGTAADPAARSAAAAALVALAPDSRRQALVPLLGEPTVPRVLQNRVGLALAGDEPLDEALAEAMRSLPARLQTLVAERLAADRAGAKTLLAMAEEGHASRMLLRNPGVRQRLLAATPEAEDRIAALTANLPSESDEIHRLIETRREGFARAETSAARGAEVFARNCANCHQIAGKGELIGPQLDGIGLRGLERLLEDVLDPNRNVDVAFRTTTIVLEDGNVVTGLVRREEGALLVLADNQGQEFTVRQDEIEEQVTSNLSLMPANVQEILPEEDFYHLMAYLLSAREPHDGQSQ